VLSCSGCYRSCTVHWFLSVQFSSSESFIVAPERSSGLYVSVAADCFKDFYLERETRSILVSTFAKIKVSWYSVAGRHQALIHRGCSCSNQNIQDGRSHRVKIILRFYERLARRFCQEKVLNRLIYRRICRHLNGTCCTTPCVYVTRFYEEVSKPGMFRKKSKDSFTVHGYHKNKPFGKQTN